MRNETYHRDDYFILHVTVPSGFEFKIASRGFNLKSWLAFEENLNSKVVLEQVNEEMYNHVIYGDPLDPLGELQNGRTIENQAQQENVPERSRGKAKAKDSKAAPRASKRTTQAGKAKPSVVRKSPVRNVCQPKKDVQGTDNSGTKTPTRSRKPKGSSQ